MSSSGTVVVIHPDPRARSELGRALERAGFTAMLVLDPSAAVSTTARTRGAVVLLAPDGPGVDGYQILRALRSDPTTHEVPVIVLTPSSGEQDIGDALEAGADDFVFEPIRPAELRARIRSQLRLHSVLDELAHEKQDAQVMLELTQALSSSLDFREILYTVVRRIAEVIGVSRVSVVLAPEPMQGDVGYVVVASDDERLTNLKLDLTKYPEIQQVLRTRRPLTINDASKHPVLDVVRDEVQNAELCAMSLFPIVWEDQAIGVLFLRAHAERGKLSDRESHFCQIVANATAVALRNARVMQSLRDHTQQITFARFEAERRLRSLKRYADLFASVAEGIAACDSDGVILFANPRAYEICGLQEATIQGKKVTDLVHPEDREKARSLWSGLAEGNYPRGVDFRLVRGGDSSEIVVSCSFASMEDGDNVVLVSFQDVTEQRRTEAELVKTMEFLESLIDASVDGIIAADIKGNLILFNPSAERIYGYKAEDVIGKMNARSLYPGDGAREVMRRLRAPQAGGIGRLEPTRFEALDSSGQIIPIQISAAIIYESGQPAATFGIFTDLREKLRAEERLAEAQQKLAVTEKQGLIAELAGTAAHELNQPLTSILACAELLRRRMQPTPAESRALDLLVRESERMADIVRKIGNITNYETKSYVGGQKILDLDKAQGGSEPRLPRVP